MKNQSTEMTIIALANAAELVRGVARTVVGNDDIADTFNGSELTDALLYQTAQSQFQAFLQPTLGGQ